MAIAVDIANLGSGGSVTGSSTVAFTTTGTVAAGGFIAVGVGWFSIAGAATLLSVAGGSLSWNPDKQGFAADGSERCVGIASAQAPAGLASGTTITATFSEAADGQSIGGASFTGVKTSSPVDGTPLGPTNSAVAAWSTGNYTIADGSVIFAACFNQNVDTAGANNTATAPSVETWDIGIDTPGGFGLCGEYRIESTGGPFPVAGTWATADGNTNIAVAYLAASEAPPTGVSNRFLTRHSRMTSW